MRHLLELAGVDYVQWRALMRVYTVIDFGALRGAYGAAETRRAALQLVAYVGLTTTIGFGLAFTVWIARDVLLAAAIATTTMMLWSGLAVLTQSTALLTPEDHAIVGFRPVTSRTYFAVRLGALLRQTGENAVLLGWLPVLAFLTRADGSLLLAASAAAAIAGAAASVVAGVVAMYGWLLLRISPSRLTRIATLAGGAASIALSAGVMVAMHYLTESDTPGAVFNTIIPRDLRTMWFPGVWFAAYVALAGGSRGAAEVLTALLSVLLLVAVMLALRGRMSVDYAARLAELDAISKPQGTSSRREWTVLKGEARAVALLVGSHLGGDTRFQLATASNVAMAFVLMLMSSSFRLPVDPFTATAAERAGDIMMPMFPLLFVPMQMYQGIVLSQAHEASWVFFSAPADRARLVTRARDAVALFVLLPAIVLLGLLFIYAYRQPWHALLQAVLLGGIAYAALQFSVFLAPRLPFSVPMVRDRARGFPFATGMIVVLVGMPFLIGLQFLAYRSPAYTSLAFITVLATIWLLNVLTRRRVERRASTLSYW